MFIPEEHKSLKVCQEAGKKYYINVNYIPRNVFSRKGIRDLLLSSIECLHDCYWDPNDDMPETDKWMDKDLYEYDYYVGTDDLPCMDKPKFQAIESCIISWDIYNKCDNEEKKEEMEEKFVDKLMDFPDYVLHLKKEDFPGMDDIDLRELQESTARLDPEQKNTYTRKKKH